MGGIPVYLFQKWPTRGNHWLCVHLPIPWPMARTFELLSLEHKRRPMVATGNSGGTESARATSAQASQTTVEGFPGTWFKRVGDWLPIT